MPTCEKRRPNAAKAKAIIAFDSQRLLRGRDDDPDDGEFDEQKIAEVLRQVLPESVYNRIMSMLASASPEDGGGDEPSELDRQREDELDHIPLDGKDHQRRGLTPSARAALDAEPPRVTHSAEAGFKSRFPSARRPGQSFGHQ